MTTKNSPPYEGGVAEALRSRGGSLGVSRLRTRVSGSALMLENHPVSRSGCHPSFGRRGVFLSAAASLSNDLIDYIRKLVKTFLTHDPFGREDRPRRKSLTRTRRVLEQYLIGRTVESDSVSSRNITGTRC